MKQNVTVSLPEKINSDLQKIAKDEGLSKSQIIRNALQDYLYIRKFKALRNRMIAKAQAQKLFSDEDVFNKVS
ncbi:CopG family transcriptional regulator [candidate division KSB1 bacterium]|nr:CopG family transcriptional regulator [candidate division KSB1 bacterium]NIR70784.1 CopG family transcriptional regulator [candidate division KSB1 bacterium]NIS27799.1 CopG family transcriptional regulator [candidate division KSB1 bacterium]NIT74681.1 CopG family transcriptional regulator [candidate division KSB1 bacterium]NIU28466.1 CopG family transcriptional regulator [candidate division KSB1 bacterium]